MMEVNEFTLDMDIVLDLLGREGRVLSLRILSQLIGYRLENYIVPFLGEVCSVALSFEKSASD
jgi:hypothetical protein